ncbi:DNA end-binding protein Ku [Algoriphagus ratkowskyi]|uniref:Non-homologous end joining protein Ku n=1 Tax=Algoriphagus ratkowskyi TaxID=57028 RepID=A0A2W7RQS8_9BACT|nr:Ku protein [Algoriphagus ratkowskyi]PZX61286.1 DNA end-binding protein Ku [Algoriphagus ratkowskyi]TXD79399.1 Ku protein [Algoriphagus ratkowskyi]
MKSIWNGTLGFGLVNIPIKMYSASENRTIDLDMLDSEDHARIRYQRVNEKTGKEVEWKNIVKGFKMDDKYIILEDEDFEEANAKKSKVIEIEAFVEEVDVADMLFKKPYFLEPQKEGGKAYNLLRDALKKTKKLGLATFVMRQKENLCLIGIYNDVLVLHVIRFSDEIRNPSDLKISTSKTTKKEVEMAESLIKQYSEKFDLSQYKDQYNEQLMKVIKAKSKGKKAVVKKFVPENTPSKDLMAQLKASLEKRKKAS